MNVYAVLLDVVSIQKYIFGSKKLKGNLGASYLIEEIYLSHLQQAIKKILSYDKMNFVSWKGKPDECLIKDTKVSFEIGYIGGGNALLLFSEIDKAKDFIREWTKILMVEAPGVITAVACNKFDLNNFKKSVKELFGKLWENKYQHVPQTIIPRHGITAECPYTGYSMEIWHDKKKEYMSSVANASINVSESATNNLERDFEEELKKGEFSFTENLDSLGQSKGENNYIAIVHIDGNEIGKMFRESDSLPKIRNLAIDVDTAIIKSFKHLLNNITNKDKYVKIMKFLGHDTPEKQRKLIEANGKKKPILIRPIILGGDDITFVCDGRLGIWFAKIFIEAFEKQEIKNGQPLTACAGIAITKTKYPFYRGYVLAEELCKNAKEVRREKNNSGSWLDFHISSGGFSGTLKDIRDSNYKHIQGELFFRPYKIGTDREKGVDILLNKIEEIRNNLPNTKIQKLRKVLTMGKEATETFINELKARNKELPSYSRYKYHIALFEDEKTPYYDMIELMDFYPDFELKEKVQS
ncbi:MAG: hypothetical protein E3K32_03370 [wastewater metagenome]|nr:hypothetical protein [Candidatus Loosdrechtia aerotolerans]